MVKKLREERGMTQAELAKKASVTEAYVSMIEAGKRKSPSLPVLRRLARALGKTIAELLE